MAPTIIVADDENAGDVAARLLDIADHQREVRTRTDLPRLAFDVPDKVYDTYVGGAKAKNDRPDDEQRQNSVQRAAAANVDPDAVVPADGDELPDLAKVGEPGEGEQGGEIVSDELPALAKITDPPSNGDAPNNGDGFTDDEGDDQGDAEAEKPKPRKRAPRAKKAAAPAAPSSDK